MCYFCKVYGYKVYGDKLCECIFLVYEKIL